MPATCFQHGGGGGGGDVVRYGFVLFENAADAARAQQVLTAQGTTNAAQPDHPSNHWNVCVHTITLWGAQEG